MARARSLPALQTGESPKVFAKNVAVSRAKREARLAQYQQVTTLRKQEFSQTAIAGQVGISHATVSRWLSNGTFPEQKPRTRSSSIDPYLPQLVERWQEGLSTIAQVHQELVAHGYSHQYNSVYRRLTRSLQEGRKKRHTRSLPAEQKDQAAFHQLPRPALLARQGMFLFLCRPEELSAEDQETLTQLRSLHAEVDQTYALVQQFAHMLRTRTGGTAGRLAWPRESQPNPRVAGLTLPQNNGLVEEHVNKLKLIKRMGYGRASVPLLHQRILHAL